MGMFSMCPACGSDYCVGCECVKKELEAAKARIAVLEQTIDNQRYLLEHPTQQPHLEKKP